MKTNNFPEATGEHSRSRFSLSTEETARYVRIISQSQGIRRHVDLFAWRARLREFIPEEARPYFIESTQESHMEFPVLRYPQKVKSLNLEKQPEYTGRVMGIKGQYLIFEDDTVFNVRGSEGYYVGLEIA